MTVVDLSPLVKTVDVRRSARDAFRIFTAEVSAWWPMATHTRAKNALGQKTTKVIIEPRVGGRVYETLADGEELEWGEVSTYEPGALFAMEWHLGRPMAQATTVTVSFIPIDAQNTRVTLTHENWQRMGEEAENLRKGYAGGWATVFEKNFKAYADQQSAG